MTIQQSDDDARMPVVAALEVLVELRREDDVVVTNQGSSRMWPRLSDHPLDFNFNPSTMGGAVPLAVGIALAQPKRNVMVISGDGALLMSLGCLVTAIDSGAVNLTVVLLDNGLYEVTGGQKTPSAKTQTDFAGLAQAAGFPNVSQFWTLPEWKRRAGDVLSRRGPRFVSLAVEPVPRDCFDDPTPPIDQQIARFQAALRNDSLQ